MCAKYVPWVQIPSTFLTIHLIDSTICLLNLSLNCENKQIIGKPKFGQKCCKDNFTAWISCRARTANFRSTSNAIFIANKKCNQNENAKERKKAEATLENDIFVSLNVSVAVGR